MITAIDNVVNAISGFLYKPFIVPLILVLAGLYFTIRLGGIQIKDPCDRTHNIPPSTKAYYAAAPNFGTDRPAVLWYAMGR